MRIASISLSLLLPISGCHYQNNESGLVHATPEVSRGGNGLEVGHGPYLLEEKKLIAALKAASSGDTSAMATLEKHYSGADDGEKALYWLDRQVALNHPFAMQRKAAFLSSIGGRSCTQAADLLKRAIVLSDRAELTEALRLDLEALAANEQCRNALSE